MQKLDFWWISLTASSGMTVTGPLVATGLCAKLFLTQDITSHKMIKISPLMGPV